MAGRAPKRRPATPAASPRHAPSRSANATSSRRYAIVAARFNEPITLRLVDGARRALASGGIKDDAVDVYWVPGSFELPQAAGHLAATGAYAGVVCLGVVIRGQTPHFEHVAREAAAGIRQVAIDTGVPTAFGVITALDETQALDRAGGEVGNRGEEAAEAALEMSQFVDHVRARFPAQGSRRAGRR